LRFRKRLLDDLPDAAVLRNILYSVRAVDHDTKRTCPKRLVRIRET